MSVSDYRVPSTDLFNTLGSKLFFPFHWEETQSKRFHADTGTTAHCVHVSCVSVQSSNTSGRVKKPQTDAISEYICTVLAAQILNWACLQPPPYLPPSPPNFSFLPSNFNNTSSTGLIPLLNNLHCTHNVLGCPREGGSGCAV